MIVYFHTFKYCYAYAIKRLFKFYMNMESVRLKSDKYNFSTTDGNFSGAQEVF